MINFIKIHSFEWINVEQVSSIVLEEQAIDHQYPFLIIFNLINGKQHPVEFRTEEACDEMMEEFIKKINSEDFTDTFIK